MVNSCCFILSVKSVDLYWFTDLQYSSLPSREVWGQLFWDCSPWKLTEGSVPGCFRSMCKLQTTGVFLLLFSSGVFLVITVCAIIMSILCVPMGFISSSVPPVCTVWILLLVPMVHNKGRLLSPPFVTTPDGTCIERMEDSWRIGGRIETGIPPWLRDSLCPSRLCKGGQSRTLTP